jgi:alpha-beta hydrolase superfamily lysophospholipase
MEKKKRKRKLPSWLRWTLWVLLVQFILFNLSAALYAYKFTHVYDVPESGISRSSGNFFTKTWRLFSGPRQFRSAITSFPAFQYQTIKLAVGNMIFIDTWYARTDSNAKGTVILFHGIMGNKGMLIAEASEFLSYGYNVMLVDFRAHGNSGGNTTTIGVRESKEVRAAYEYLVKEGEKNILLYGVSMGAVVVSKAIADYDLKPSGVFLDMPFASMQSHLQARLRAMGFERFIEKPFSFFVTFWMGVENGTTTFKHRTSDYVSMIKCPVLMQWGALDNIALKNETDEVYNAIATPHKKLVIYDHAGHESLLQNDPVKWRTEVEKFLGDNNK